jgi:hypothetical protein
MHERRRTVATETKTETGCLLRLSWDSQGANGSVGAGEEPPVRAQLGAARLLE